MRVSGFGDLSLEEIRNKDGVLKERLEDHKRHNGGPIENINYDAYKFPENSTLTSPTSGPFVLATFKNSEGVLIY